MITKPTVLCVVSAMLIGTLCATHIAHAQSASAPTPVRNVVPPAAPMAAPIGGLSTAALSVAIAGKLDIDNVITVAGETVKLHATFSRSGMPVNGASLQFRLDGASVGQGVTSANGATDVPYKLIDSLTLGVHTILVTFPGDSKSRETTSTAKMTVLKSNTALTASMSMGSYGYPNIRGILRGASDDVRLANRKVTLKDNGAPMDTRTTDSFGAFNFQFQPKMGHSFMIEFDGEANYLGTTRTIEPPKPSGTPGIPHIGNLP